MTAPPRTVNVCFHGIGEPRRQLEPGEDAYWITRDRYLEVLDEIAGWPSVAISFDDGNASDAELGLPALVDRGLVASFFLLAGRVGQPGSLDVGQLGELASSGMRLGSHGMDHRPWTKLDEAGRHRELVEARELLHELSGGPIEEAACPLGQYDRAVLRALRRCGYTRVHTSDRTTAPTGAWLQPRYSVRCDDTAASFRTAVLGRQALRHRIRPRVVGAFKRIR